MESFSHVSLRALRALCVLHVAAAWSRGGAPPVRSQSIRRAADDGAPLPTVEEAIAGAFREVMQQQEQTITAKEETIAGLREQLAAARSPRRSPMKDEEVLSATTSKR